MSLFVLRGDRLILNRTAAADGRVPLGAWDLGSAAVNSFLSTRPAKEGSEASRSPKDTTQGQWRLQLGSDEYQLLVYARKEEIGQVNRRAAAILAPLLRSELVEVEFQQYQGATGAAGTALYIFAKLGVRDNQQVVREPSTTVEARAYVALLACTMKALRAAGESADREPSLSEGVDEDRLSEGSASELTAASWDRLPGAVRWDCTTGSIGNTVNLDLIDQLGSRTMAVLRQSGAQTVQQARSSSTCVSMDG